MMRSWISIRSTYLGDSFHWLLHDALLDLNPVNIPWHCDNLLDRFLNNLCLWDLNNPLHHAFRCHVSYLFLHWSCLNKLRHLLNSLCDCVSWCGLIHWRWCVAGNRLDHTRGRCCHGCHGLNIACGWCHHGSWSSICGGWCSIRCC